jgi:hypothetical protein
MPMKNYPPMDLTGKAALVAVLARAAWGARGSWIPKIKIFSF